MSFGYINIRNVVMQDTKTNSLEEALNKLDLKGTLVMLNLLAQKAIYMVHTEETKEKKIIPVHKSPLIL